jgi:hypothetical protein
MERSIEVYEPLRLAVEKLKFKNSNFSFEFARPSAVKMFDEPLSIEGEPLVEC